jgi:hypothetical protein
MTTTTHLHIADSEIPIGRDRRKLQAFVAGYLDYMLYRYSRDIRGNPIVRLAKDVDVDYLEGYIADITEPTMSAIIASCSRFLKGTDVLIQLLIELVYPDEPIGGWKYSGAAFASARNADAGFSDVRYVEICQALNDVAVTLGSQHLRIWPGRAIDLDPCG